MPRSDSASLRALAIVPVAAIASAVIACSSSDEFPDADREIPPLVVPNGPSESYVESMKRIDAIDSPLSSPEDDVTPSYDFDDGLYFSEARRPVIEAAPGALESRPWHDNMPSWTHDGTGWTRDDGETYLVEREGPLLVDEEGAVLEGLYVRGNVKIAANRVTFRGCLLDGVDKAIYGVNTADGQFVGTRFEDCEFVRYRSAAAYGSSFALIGCNIHDMHSDGIKPTGDVLVERCFIHRLGSSEGAHADGAQFVGVGKTTFRSCHFWMPTPRSENAPSGDYKSNAALFICTNNAPIEGVVVEGCWLNGGNYTIYNTDKGRGHGSPIGTRLRFNRVGRDFQYGALRNDADDISIVGNVWDETGEPCDMRGR